MKSRLSIWIIAIVTVLAASAQAGTIAVFTGQDDGVAIGGPFPNSVTAKNNFLAAAGAFGTVNNHGFESQPLGFQTNNVWFNGDGGFTELSPNLGDGRGQAAAV